MSAPRLARLAVFVIAGTTLGTAALAGPALSDAQQVIAALQFPPSALHVIGAIASGDRPRRSDEPLVLSARVSRPAYVAVLQVMRAGDTTQVFPSRTQPDPLLSAANAPVRIPIPPSASSAAGDRSGVVLYEFIAATKGTSWLFHPRPAAGAEFAVFGPTTRALAHEIRMSLRPGPGNAAATAFLVVRVAP